MTAPGPVTAVAQSSGGSGEVQVDWTAIAGATGYRVTRTDDAGDDGHPDPVAEFDITTGHVTAARDVINIWSAEHSYVPDRGPLTATDHSPWFQYVDFREGTRCYRVQAFNAGGSGPWSAITCASPGDRP